ncbi:MAG: hypothetical protein JW828_15255, partial [Sedimentisphaerales bacterium]|nr:hypothetical protein [Sedimentisphaerales bacterium]
MKSCYLNRAAVVFFVSFLPFFNPCRANMNCPVGDLDGDCRVDMADLLVFSEQWLSEPDCVETGLVGRWKLD